jgi:hypothetical protein
VTGGPGILGPMVGRPTSKWWGVVLDASDARTLGQFYARRLGWRITHEEPGHSIVAPPDVVAYLTVQTAPRYVRP